MQRRRDERGAVAVLTGVLVLVLAGAASFAVDLGYLRVAKRDMQAVADLVAMDMARRLDGGTTAQVLAASWSADLTLSRDRNDREVVGVADLPVTTCGEAEVRAVDARLAAPGICAYPGVLQADGTFTDSGAGAATHVKVLTQTQVDYFLPVFDEDGPAGAVAIARADSAACLRLGSFAVNLDSRKSAILDAVLADALNTTALGYTGLATAEVSLLDLAAELAAGSPEQVLSTQVTVRDFYLAMADVLVRNGDTANATLLQSIAAAANVTATVKLDDLLSVDNVSSAVLSSEWSVLDLVAGSAFVANGTNLLSIPAATVNVPGLENVSIGLKVIEAPRGGCGRIGRARAETAQFELTLTGKMQNVDLGITSLLGAKANVDVALELKSAESTALLTDATCGAGTVASPMAITADVQNSLASLRLRADSRVHVLGIAKIGILATMSDSASSGTTSATVVVDSEPADPGDWAVPTRTGSGSLGLVGASVTTTVTSGDGSLLSVVLPELQADVYQGLSAGLDTQLVTPVAELFGLTLGGSDLYAVKPGPTCDNPALAG